MPFALGLSNHADQLVRSLHARQRFQFEQIAAALADDPFPDKTRAPIREARFYGRTYFLYFDGVFPYVLVYRVFRGDAGAGGLVYIVSLQGSVG